MRIHGGRVVGCPVHRWRIKSSAGVPRTSRRLDAGSFRLVNRTQVRVRNVRAREPLVKRLEGKLWELREESSTNIYRLVYFFFTGRRIVFVHGFQKKTQKTPPGEIAIALERMHRFVDRVGGDNP